MVGLLFVQITYTNIDPITMMIIVFDTSVTQFTMTSIIFCDCATNITNPFSLNNILTKNKIRQLLSSKKCDHLETYFRVPRS